MKASQFRKLIREEVRKVLQEVEVPTFPKPVKLTPKANKNNIPSMYLKDDERGRRWTDSLNKTIELMDKFADFEQYGDAVKKALPYMNIEWAVDPKDGFSFPSNFVITNRAVNKVDKVYKDEIIYAGGPKKQWWLTHWGHSY